MNQPPDYQNQPQQQQQPQYIYVEAPERKSVASGVFWGLFLFFILLPIASCGACVVCGGATSALHH